MGIVYGYPKLYREVWVLYTATQSYVIGRRGYCRQPLEVMW